MFEEKFKIGDRVEAFGLLGRIITRHNCFDEWYDVEFDEPHHTYHSCTGLGKMGYCYWVAEDDIKLLESETPKVYNGKFVVIDTHPALRYTVGKIYEVKDGRWRCDHGGLVPVEYDKPCKTFKEVEKLCLADIIEVVE